MKRSALVITAIMLLVGSGARATCVDHRVGILAMHPKFFNDRNMGCSAAGSYETLPTLAGEVGIPEDSVCTFASDVLSDSPAANLGKLETYLPESRTLFLKTEGNSGGFCSDFYKTENARDLAESGYTGWSGLLDTGTLELYDENNERVTTYWIAVPNAAIQTKLQPLLPGDPILGLVSCESAQTASSWTTDSEAAVFSYTQCVSTTVDCFEIECIINAMGCGLAPSVQNTAGDARSACKRESTLELTGSEDARWNCYADCQITTAGEDPGVPPRSVGDADEMVAGVIDPESAESADFQLGGVFGDAIAGTVAGSEGGTLGGVRTRTPDCAECGDILAYSSTGHGDWLDLVATQVTLTPQDSHGQYFSCKKIAGNTGPSAIRAAYAAVLDANMAWNEEHIGAQEKHYEIPPVLIVVGDCSVVEPITFDNEPYNHCGVNACRSYALLTDIDDDGIGEGPVSVIPGETPAEIERACDTADDWNDNRDVSPSGSALVLLGDRAIGGDYEPLPWFTEKFAYLFQLMDGEWHQPLRGFLRESDFEFDAIDEMAQASGSLVNRGVRDVWLQGYSTDYSHLTRFVNYLDLTWTRRQRVLVYAPSCQTAFTCADSSSVRQLLFQDPSKTVAAGIVGVMNGGYLLQNDAVRDALANAITGALDGTPVATVAWRAGNAVAARFPTVAAGLVCLGSLTLSKRSVLPPTTIEDADGTLREISLKVVWGPGESRELVLENRFRGRLQIRVYDVAGREIATIADQSVGTGVHRIPWSGTELSRGVYFLKASITAAGGEMSDCQKLLVLR